MKEKTIEYRIYEKPKIINDIISTEIKENVFKKRFNLSGDISNNSGIYIYSSVSFIMFKPNLGPLIKLNLTCVNSNNEGTESKLKLERVNGLTFYTQYWFSLIFSGITFIISIYQITINRLDKIEILFLPIFGIAYFFIINIIASSSTDNLISKIENVLKTERIKFKKL